MKKIILCFTLTLLTQTTFAAFCDSTQVDKRVASAALYLESKNGGGHPLTKELYSLNSQQNTYIAIFSYSGIQNFWKIQLDQTGCYISSITKQ